MTTLPVWLDTFLASLPLDREQAARLRRIVEDQQGMIQALGRGLGECSERARKLEAER